MAHVVINACGDTTQTATNGTLTLESTAPSGYGVLQTLAAAITASEAANSDTVDYHLLDANGTAWESGRGTITNGTTFVRTTVYRSTASDVAITLSSGTHTILFSPSAHALTAPRGHIEFDDQCYLSWNSADGDAVTISGGQGWIGSKYMTWSTSDVSDSAISLGEIGAAPSDALRFIYLFDSSGTVDSEFSATVPAYSSTLGFWTKDGDTSRRLVGWFLVWEPASGTERITPFVGTIRGRCARISYYPGSDGTTHQGADDFQVVSNLVITANVNMTQFALQGLSGKVFDGVDIVPETPAGLLTEWCLSAKIDHNSASGDSGVLGVNPGAPDETTQPVPSSAHYAVRNGPGSAAAGKTFFGRYWMPYGGVSPYYGVDFFAGSLDAQIECFGGGFQL